jgi:hypothetical protein
VQRRDAAGLPSRDPGPGQVIEAAIDWIRRAQDHSRTRDGGVARDYSLTEGWSASYPETTGYIVPTMFEFAEEQDDADAAARGLRMLDWLVSLQFPEGAFHGGRVDQAPRVPVTFNTGQILMGLAAGTRRDARYRAPMRRAADWLIATQDADGCWRRHATPFAAPGEKVYETHVAWGLLQTEAVDPGRGCQQAALAQVDWALGHQAGNGWFPKCCLSLPEKPLTHTLGYTLRGIVEAYLASRNDLYLQAACRTADGLLSALGPDGRLPGRLDAAWRAAADWVCLTGTSQIAHSWLLLHRETGRTDYLQAGRRANAYVRRTIATEGPADTLGGVAGSFPIDGGYGRWHYLNWAAKFTIDANHEELRLVTPK